MVVQNYCARAWHSNITRPTHHSNMEVDHSKAGAESLRLVRGVFFFVVFFVYNNLANGKDT